MKADNIIRYALHHEGWYIGQPMTGEGTFGEWALADIFCSHGVIQTITFERLMTEHEIQNMLSQPIDYWFRLAHPKINPHTDSWALMQYRYNQLSEKSRTIYTPRNIHNLSNKVAV